MTRVVIAALAAAAVSLTLSLGIRQAAPAAPQAPPSLAACLAGADHAGSGHSANAGRSAAGRCDNHDGADRVMATDLPGPTSLHESHASGESRVRVQPPPANRRRVLTDLAIARAHDPTHLHTYSLLI